MRLERVEFLSEKPASWEEQTVNLRTPKEAAEKLNVASVTVLRLFDSGALPGVVIRQGARKRVVRFREETLERFIASREQRPGK